MDLGDLLMIEWEIGAKVNILNVIAKHVVSGGEHGGGHCENGLLGARRSLMRRIWARRLLV
ncbi:hypothetical protein N234_26180 [Ralstonia pickettii DTP0602]|nr:hypothetical protein N234_26180 [Ralstonia pickettii DTP0602]